MPLKDDKMALKYHTTGDKKTSADFFWGQEKHRNFCAVWKEVYLTQPSFISVSTHPLASTEINSEFRSKLAWFNIALLVETEKWSLWKEGYRREKWSSSSNLLKTKVTAIGEGAITVKNCWHVWKKEEISAMKIMLFGQTFFALPVRCLLSPSFYSPFSVPHTAFAASMYCTARQVKQVTGTHCCSFYTWNQILYLSSAFRSKVSRANLVTLWTTLHSQFIKVILGRLCQSMPPQSSEAERILKKFKNYPIESDGGNQT